MASKAQNKGGGRTTAKGTKPPVKRPKGPEADAKTGRGDAPVENNPNRQMRRSGRVAEPVAPNTDRMRLILIAAGVVTALLVIGCIVAFRLSGTWIGVLGLAVGLGTGLAVTMGKAPLADKGRMVAIGLVVFGVVVTVIGVSGIVDFHWPFAALIGCGLGALMAEFSNQQVTPPQSPPQSAMALLKRNGAQLLPAPTAGSCVWATPDGRIRVIVGASVAEGTAADKILTDRSVRRSRQRGQMLAKRMEAVGGEPGMVLVVDLPITTMRDGDDIICSAAGLTKALAR